MKALLQLDPLTSDTPVHIFPDGHKERENQEALRRIAFTSSASPSTSPSAPLSLSSSLTSASISPSDPASLNEETKERERDHFKFDCLVAIEAAGPAKDGKFYSMRGMDISHSTADFYTLFTSVFEMEERDRKREKETVEKAEIKGVPTKESAEYTQRMVHTIGIGDGGNEIGMGSVYEKTCEYVPKGSLIGCVVPTHSLLTCGVSNWGGYALSCALLLLSSPTSSSSSAALPSLLPSPALELRIFETCMDQGVIDGVLASSSLSCDGLPFSVHEDVIKQLLAITEETLAQHT